MRAKVVGYWIGKMAIRTIALKAGWLALGLPLPWHVAVLLAFLLMFMRLK